MAQNIISITLRPNELEVKKLRDRKVDCEILPAICALLNHPDGGYLLLDSKNGTEFDQESIPSFVHSLEQKVKSFGLRAISRFSRYSKTSIQLVFSISSQPVFRPFSILSNLYLPSDCEVLHVFPAADDELIYDILNKTYKPVCSLPRPNPENWTFVKGESVPCSEECHQLQFRYLNSEKSTSKSLVHRIVNNKFASYVSAFGNDRGGRIFYGIRDDGVVGGQIFDFKTKLTRGELTRKVAEVITCQMIWPKKCGLPEKGKHWDIYFEEVTDGRGQLVPSTFVIIITVAACPGGVFATRPESYVLVEGKVQRMAFEVWKDRFVEPRISVLESCALLEYSAFNLSDDTRLIARRLAKLRQTGDMTAFRILAQHYLNEAQQLIRSVELEQAAYAAAENGHVEEAKDQNNESTKLSYEDQVPDSMVFEVKQPSFSPQISSQEMSVAFKKDWHATDKNAKIGQAGFHNLNTEPMKCNALHESL